MTAVVWKSNLRVTDIQAIEVPVDAEMLDVQVQFGEIAIWYRCDPNAPKETRTIALVGTGKAAPNTKDGRYLGTVALHNGAFILHAFERIE